MLMARTSVVFRMLPMFDVGAVLVIAMYLFPGPVVESIGVKGLVNSSFQRRRECVLIVEHK
jgi:hypothetical protein